MPGIEFFGNVLRKVWVQCKFGAKDVIDSYFSKSREIWAGLGSAVMTKPNKVQYARLSAQSNYYCKSYSVSVA